jgi:multidrug efflux pump subunit AcrA (membrane-fusion protein)
MPPSPKPHSGGRAIIWTIVALLTCGVVWSFVGELEVVSTVRGRIVAEAQMKTVQSTTPGIVKTIQVREGDTVRAGQTLIELDPVLLQADLVSLREKRADTEAELARLQVELQQGDLRQIDAVAPKQQEAFKARLTAFKQKQEEYRAVLESKKSSRAGGEDLIKSIENRLAIASEKERRARPYVDVAVPRFQRTGHTTVQQSSLGTRSRRGVSALASSLFPKAARPQCRGLAQTICSTSVRH